MQCQPIPLETSLPQPTVDEVEHLISSYLEESQCDVTPQSYKDVFLTHGLQMTRPSLSRGG
jgi:hypothetical protein